MAIRLNEYKVNRVRDQLICSPTTSFNAQCNETAEV